MKILVTGGAGYIGSKVALDLSNNGHDIFIIDNLSNGSKKLIPKKAKFYLIDISDSINIEKIIKKNKIEVVFHFAAFISVEESLKKPNKYLKNNFIKSKTFIDICTKNYIKYFIFSSTAAVYGKTNKKVKENFLTNPKNPYGKSKLKTENYIKKLQTNTKFTILRYFNVAGADKNLKTGQIGKHKSTHVIKKLTDAVIKKKTFEIFGKNYNTKDGSAVRDFIYLEDLSKIHIKILKFMMKKSTPQNLTLNCGYGLGFSILDLAINAKKLYKDFEFKFSQKRKGDLPYVVADNTKLKKILKWNIKIITIKKLIKSSVEWEKRT